MAKLKSLFAFISKIFTSSKNSVVPSINNNNPIVKTTERIKAIKVVTPISVECRTNQKPSVNTSDFQPFISESQLN